MAATEHAGASGVKNGDGKENATALGTIGEESASSLKSGTFHG